MTEAEDDGDTRLDPVRASLRGRRGQRLLIVLLLAAGIGAIWYTNAWLTARFSENTRVRAELRSALYSGNLLSELQRTSVVPLLLARDPALIGSLRGKDYATISARLIAAQKDIGAASIRLLDSAGRTVGATDRKILGTNYVLAPFYVEALRTNDTVFTVSPYDMTGFEFTYSRAIVADGRTLGVIVVGADLSRLERSWAGIQDAVAVTDSEGRIILSTEPRWRGLELDEALAVRSAPSA
ncbi:MAG TPA: cache domain-containing protein, partial [Paracoccus sp. (in: a-proteobacteria)]|nr:cache domain-containing protein [Paracoccus sp. (in: a-proteobacteria)]